MKWDQVKRNWLSVSQQVKLKWGKFTDEDLAMISGQRESFVRLFEQRYGDDQAEAERKVEAFVLGLKLPIGADANPLLASTLLGQRQELHLCQTSHLA